MDNETTKNFIENIIDEDNEKNTYGKRVHTRFPPEPNGYLHLGHAKSICLNFGIAKKYGGLTNLRFDDTNPSKENTEYVESIKRDVKWLGFDWDDRMFYASDYFDKLYEYAKKLIRLGKTASMPMGKRSCAPRSIWPARTSICATPSFTVSSMLRITGRATSGASIRCTTSLILYRTPSNALHILSARWNLKPIVRCTTGSSKTGTIRKARNRGRSNLPA